MRSGKQYLFCEVSMDSFSLGKGIDGIASDDFDDCVERPYVVNDVDDSEVSLEREGRIYEWDLDSYLGNKLTGSFRLEMDGEALMSLREKNPFRTYGSDGRTYAEEVRLLFDYEQYTPNALDCVDELADYILEATKSLPEVDKLQFALDFCQQPNIDYRIDEKCASIFFAKEYMRYADEVLFDKEGDCDCKTSLAAALMWCMGFNSAFLMSVKLGHAALGVECSADTITSVREALEARGVPFVEDDVVVEHEGIRYLFCETTGDGFKLGQIETGCSVKDFETIVPFKRLNG